MSIDEAKIEREAQLLRSFACIGQYSDLHEAEAVIERLRLDVALNELDGPTRGLYRAAVHYLEEVVERRHAAENLDRLATRRRIADYMHGLLNRLSGSTAA